jgi:hypothetical protein
MRQRRFGKQLLNIMHRANRHFAQAPLTDERRWRNIAQAQAWRTLDCVATIGSGLARLYIQMLAQAVKVVVRAAQPAGRIRTQANNAFAGGLAEEQTVKTNDAKYIGFRDPQNVRDGVNSLRADMTEGGLYIPKQRQQRRTSAPGKFIE